MPLARARFEGGEDPIFGGGIILDLPKLGWIQGGYDQFYGASAGTGFNLNQRLSFGYNFEKSLNSSIANLGVTHEISIAYSFVPNLSKNTFVSNDDEIKKRLKTRLSLKQVMKPQRQSKMVNWMKKPLCTLPIKRTGPIGRSVLRNCRSSKKIVTL